MIPVSRYVRRDSVSERVGKPKYPATLKHVPSRGETWERKTTVGAARPFRVDILSVDWDHNVIHVFSIRDQKAMKFTLDGFLKYWKPYSIRGVD